MPEYRCKCGRRIEYDVIQGRFREIKADDETILKIRCSEKTKEMFKALKESTASPNYEALLHLLMTLKSI